MLTPPVMTSQAGPWLKGEKQEKHVGGPSLRCLMSGHSRRFLVIKKFRNNGPCIVVRNTRSRLKLKIWWNTNLDLFVNKDVVYSVNAFVSILTF